ncbi:ABC transporter ATP-binding protein [bacterium]|nr:ABC transporter ATP-binding protein [bacterium]
MNRIVEFKGVHRAYAKDAPVLDGISFTIDGGEVIGLLGKNGAGKTTLLHVAMGMLEAQDGQARVFGLDPRRDAVEVKRRIGFVSEDQALPSFFTADQVMDVHRGLFPTWDEDLARELLQRFALPTGRKVGKLSKGEARQLALLCAVSHRPELLVLDEPAGGLDPHARRGFLETSIKLLNETGTTIIFSSHHMTDVERMASRLLMLHEGQIWIDSELDDIREGYCLALLPVDTPRAADRLLAQPRCICVRERPDAVRAVFEMGADACRTHLSRELDLPDATCRPLPLEEMFIELVGGTS